MVRKISVSETKNNDLCLCKSIRPGLLVCRYLGLFPIISVHEDGRCVFKKCNKWFVYSLIVILFSAVRIFFTTEILDLPKLTSGKSLHVILVDINDIIYAVYVTILAAANVARYPTFTRTLNKIAMLMKEGLLCQSALKVILKIQRYVIGVIFVVVVVQYATLMGLHFSSSYRTDYDYKIYVNRVNQNVTFTLYVVFFAMCAVLMGALGCFEKLAINCMNYVPMHPCGGVYETNNRVDYIGLFTYELCKETHRKPQKLMKLSNCEQIEYLRRLHEDICVIMYDVNMCLNPQFLLHTMVELTVLIINWYAVVIYLVYTFVTPFAGAIHLMNVIFVAVHTFGLFVFLKNAQQLQNMVRALINLLLEYSTRISSSEDHQQVRIFIEKLKEHRSLMASGVFTVDLGIAAPVCANILTYVLVALQFDVPKT